MRTRVDEDSERSICVQLNRIAIITGVCVAGLAVVLVAIALGARRKVRTDVYSYSAPGNDGSTTANFTEYSNHISGTLPGTTAGVVTRPLSGTGGLSPAAISPASSPHHSPQGPPTYFDVDSPRATGGGSAAGSTNNAQTVTVGAVGAAQVTSHSLTGHRLTATGEDDTGTLAIAELDVSPFATVFETSTM